MVNCCTKLVDGTTCPAAASRTVTLQARGLVFKVPICETHFKMMPAAPKDAADIFRDAMLNPKR